MGRVGMRAAAGLTATGRARPATLERVAKSDPIDRNQERHDPSRWRMPGVGSRFRLDQQERALKLFRTLTAAGAIAAATIAPALAVDISGAGATFPYPIYAKWADAYKKETGIGLNYQSIGSGGGIKQIKAKTVTFGATDTPLNGEELDKSGLVQFPMVMGGIVPVVNLDGIKPGELDARRPDARQDLPRRDQELGRPGDREAQPERQAADAGDRRRAPLGRLGHDLQLHQLPVEGEPRLEVQGRRQHRGRMAGRHRRQGQRRRRQQRRPDQGLDRLRRIRLRQAEQADLHQDDQQGRQDRRADRGGLPGGRRQCRLEVGRRASA